MTGHCLVRRFSKSGNYKSELDYDASFVDTNNPTGLFKMVIQPIKNGVGKDEIRYMKTADGLLISGEAYIITGADEKEIDAKCKRYTSEHWDHLVQTKVNTEDELW